MVDMSRLASDRNGGLIHVDVRGSQYAIAISKVREVVRWSEITPLPNSPALVEGVADMRDALVPIVDLGRALFGVSIECSATARIVLVEPREMLIGLLVDRVFGVMQIEGHGVENFSALPRTTVREIVCGVIRRPGNRPIGVLSLENLVEIVGCSEQRAMRDCVESVSLP